MGKKRQAKKLGLQQEKTQQTKKEEQEKFDWFWMNLFMFVCLIALISLALLLKNGTEEYYHAQNGLFVTCAIAMLSFVVRQKVTDHMFNSLKKLFQSSINLDQYEKGDILLAAIYLLSFCAIFIVDTSFFRNYGFRIGTVVAISAFELLRRFVFTKRT